MVILFKCLLSTRIILQFPELLRELSDLYSGGKKTPVPMGPSIHFVHIVFLGWLRFNWSDKNRGGTHQHEEQECLWWKLWIGHTGCCLPLAVDKYPLPPVCKPLLFLDFPPTCQLRQTPRKLLSSRNALPLQSSLSLSSHPPPPRDLLSVLLPHSSRSPHLRDRKC